MPRDGIPQGSTTQQMNEASQGALYIWPNDLLDYPKALARHLGREDLVIVAPYYLDHFESWAKRWPEVIVDHGATLNLKRTEALTKILEWLRK